MIEEFYFYKELQFIIKFTTYNIQFGRGLDGNIDLDRIAATVADADVIALQEVARFLPLSNFEDQVTELAKLLDLHYWVYGAGVDFYADLASSGSDDRSRRCQFGNMLLSRTPILSCRNHFLPKSASIGPLSIQRSALEGVIQCGATNIRVYSIHLTHISQEVRLQQIERILEIDRNAVREGGPISGDPSHTVFQNRGNVNELPRKSILMGDFNFSPDAAEYDRIVGPKSDYGGRVINPEGHVDAWVFCGNDELSGITAERRGEDVRMDYCFVSCSLRHQINSVAIDSDSDGSDHKPVTVNIDF